MIERDIYGRYVSLYRGFKRKVPCTGIQLNQQRVYRFQALDNVWLVSRLISQPKIILLFHATVNAQSSVSLHRVMACPALQVMRVSRQLLTLRQQTLPSRRRVAYFRVHGE